MRRFIQLYLDLDETNSTNAKISLLSDYFREADPADAIWVVFFLSGQRFKRLISSRLLRRWVVEEYRIPKWLFDEAMIAVGDTGETISLLVDTLQKTRPAPETHQSLSQWISGIQELSDLTEDQQQNRVVSWWSVLDQDGVFLLNKLLTGAFRVGVSQQIVARALAEAYDLEKAVVLQRMMGQWQPTAEFFTQLTSDEGFGDRIAIPYPFFLASPLDRELTDLGNIEDWFVEWKWDGIRAQVIKRNEEVFLWSRGEELINRAFPEIVAEMGSLPNGTVIDGEILAYFQGQPLAFSVLQRRIGRHEVDQDIMKEAPVVLMAYDLLEAGGEDIRQEPHNRRRKKLETALEDSGSKFMLSPLIEVSSWKEVEQHRNTARKQLAEGLMLKRVSATYQVGRKRGDWYKYKVDPLSIDAILIYAQSGSGKRANLFTAYTFAVWSDDHSELIPIGRAYSGLTNEEIKELDAWIRSNTQQRFGPVRSVDPVHVFELGFDGIMTNDRAKSGLSLRFPRMLRWRRDKPAEEADTLSTTRALLVHEGITEVRRNRSLDEFF